MAEVIVAISFVSAITGLIDISCRVVKRLNDFHSRSNQIPEALQHVKAQLPLIVDSLKSTEEKSKCGSISEETKKALMPALEGCQQLILQLDEILDKFIPLKDESSWERTCKAISSLSRDKGFESLLKKLDRYLWTFTLFNSSESKILRTDKTPAKQIFMIPTKKDSKFVDRPDLFQELEVNLKVHGRAALAGLGGVGKTQIAIEFCYRFRDRNPKAQVFWAHLGTIAKFSEACKSIARKLELPGWNDPMTNNLNQVYEWLNDDKNEQWLLVLDNFDDIEILEAPLQLQNCSMKISEFLPRSTLGAILVTTRDKRVGERLAVRGKTITVSAMAMIECKRLLDSYLPSSQNAETGDREDLIKELGYLPLAITQAAAYITEKWISVEEYISMFYKGDKEMQELLSESISDDRRIGQESNSVIRTWKLSFDQIVKQNPRAAEILSLMSMLDRQEIPSNIIRKDGESMRAFLDAMAVLQNYSLISKSANGKNYGMHRLVQLSTQAWLRVQDATLKWKREALFILASIFPSGDFETWSECEILLPHIQLILPDKVDGNNCHLKRAQLLKKIAWFDRLHGHYANGILRSQEAYDIYVRVDNKENLEALSCLTTKADCLIEKGDYLIAESLLRYISSSQEHILSLDQPERLRTMGNLAWVLCKLERYQESEELHHKTLGCREQLLGFNHPDTLKSMDNLALTLNRQNKMREAEDLHRITLAARERLLGPGHPDTIESRVNLAGVLDDCNKFEEAEHLYRLAIASGERVLGVDHPNMLSYMNNMSVCLSNQRKSQEAEYLLRRALALCNKMFGADHVKTALYRWNLAGCLFDQQKFEEASRLCRTVIAIATEKHVEEYWEPHWKYCMIDAEAVLAACMENISGDLHTSNRRLKSLFKHKIFKGFKVLGGRNFAQLQTNSHFV